MLREQRASRVFPNLSFSLLGGGLVEPPTARIQRGPSDSLYRYLREWPRLPFTARIERPPLYRGGSASTEDYWSRPSSSMSMLSSLLLLLSRGWSVWSPTARVQRGPSEAARCASTGPHGFSQSIFFPLGGGLVEPPTARIERPPLYRGGSASTGGSPGHPPPSLDCPFHRLL